MPGMQLTGPRVPLVLIKRKVQEHFKLPPDALDGRSKKRAITLPRQIAMALAYEHSGLSYPGVSRRFGNRDHTTVVHARKAVERFPQKYPRLVEKVDRIRAELLAEVSARS